eukprot:360328-Chlamydomonas_euryale.AAC.15
MAPPEHKVPSSPPQSEKQSESCMGCRMVGGAFGIGGSAYLASALLQIPAPVGAHRAGIIAASSLMFTFGILRAFL